MTFDRLSRVLHSVTKALDLYVGEVEPGALFTELLGDLLALAESDYGYIAEVLHDDDGAPYLKTWAITNIAWNQETRELYEEHAVRGGGLEFRNLDTIFGWGLRDGGRLVIANDTGIDPRASGRPGGHPPLDSYLGVPIFHGAELVGQFGVANRPGGYHEDLVRDLGPFTAALGNLIDGYRTDRERRQAEQCLRDATAELTALLGSLHDAVLFVEDERRIVFVNEQFCELFGYDEQPGDLVGRSTLDIQGHARDVVEDPAGFVERVDEIYVRQEQVDDELVRLRDGRVFERDYTPVVLGPARHGHLWLYRDVTARVAIDEERAAILAHEREMRAGIEEQNRSLRELDRLKTDFVATVSHELRTPLSSIVGFADFLVEDAETLSEDHREYVEIIHRNADRLLQLVGDLLLVARLESGGLAIDPRPIALAPLIEAAVTAIGPDSAAAGVGLEVDLAADEAPVVADAGRLEQVLANLLSNAVKFTPAGGRVLLSTRRSRGAWSIVVEDDGIGIPAVELDRLFERFFRGTNVRLEELPGTGLGLPICKAIVDLHGGTLDIASEENVGTTVTVGLPDTPAVPS